MIKKILIIAAGIGLFACNDTSVKGKFTLNGVIKNAPNQKVYVEELYFTQKDPVILDTAEMSNGQFKLSALGPDQGLYRLRLEKEDGAFLFINDQPTIDFTADYNNLTPKGPTFNSPANALLKGFINTIDSQRTILNTKSEALQQYANPVKTDSIYNVMTADYETQTAAYKNYIVRYIDTSSNAVMALFALGYTRSIEPAQLEKPVAGLAKRFQKNETVTTLVTQYQQMIAQYKSKPHEGGVAPEINMPDTSGKPFALSMLKGKYVLIDFWASWCRPCRDENPNVVNAYNTFKNKNFTVLGVSLDKDKQNWLQAINEDRLTWYHISDLKYWSSAAVSLYGFDGIPYNVLVDPSGKIISTNLRGTDLLTKLGEILN